MPLEFELNTEDGDGAVYFSVQQPLAIDVVVTGRYGNEAYFELTEQEARTLAHALNDAADELRTREVK